jgi:hypothetical protein
MACRVAQVVAYLPSKCETMSSTCSATKNINFKANTHLLQYYSNILKNEMAFFLFGNSEVWCDSFAILRMGYLSIKT